MDPKTEISSNFTVENYLAIKDKLIDSGGSNAEWQELLDAFERRIQERFLQPIRKLLEPDVDGADPMRPGFAVLTLDCLLIDTIQSFREGRISTGNMSPAKSFRNFLNSGSFPEFNSKDKKDFFGDVRNGLFHNGETRGNWKIRKNTQTILAKENGSRIINRELFHERIEKEFQRLCTSVKTDDSSKKLFLQRIDSLCGLLEEPLLYFAYGSNLFDAELERDAADAEFVGKAFLPGYRLEFTKHSYSRDCDAANIREDRVSLVWGAVFQVSNQSKTNLGKRETGYKERTLSIFFDEDGAVRQQRVFTFIGEQECSKRCGPSTAYLDLILEGAQSRDLPKEYVTSIEVHRV